MIKCKGYMEKHLQKYALFHIINWSNYLKPS